MKKILMLGLVFALFAATASAQRGQASIERKRIHRGFETHQLTRGEKLKLQKNQAHYRHGKRKAMRNGKISHHERKELKAMRKHNSRETYRLKHNYRKRIM